MQRFFQTCLLWGLVLGGFIFTGPPARAHIWRVESPDHEQTFSYGSEQRRAWGMRGPDRHLALNLDFTNDPYVDRSNPRQYDYFTFDFPQVRLGADGHTFYYHTADGHSLPVAANNIGVDEIKLLPTSYLVIRQPHGYLSLELVVQDHPFPADDN